MARCLLGVDRQCSALSVSEAEASLALNGNVLFLMGSTEFGTPDKIRGSQV